MKRNKVRKFGFDINLNETPVVKNEYYTLQFAGEKEIIIHQHSEKPFYNLSFYGPEKFLINPPKMMKHYDRLSEAQISKIIENTIKRWGEPVD